MHVAEAAQTAQLRHGASQKPYTCSAPAGPLLALLEKAFMYIADHASSTPESTPTA